MEEHNNIQATETNEKSVQFNIIVEQKTLSSINTTQKIFGYQWQQYMVA